jgi:hypothetical protein
MISGTWFAQYVLVIAYTVFKIQPWPSVRRMKNTML